MKAKIAKLKKSKLIKTVIYMDKTEADLLLSLLDKCVVTQEAERLGLNLQPINEARIEADVYASSRSLWKFN